MVHTTELTVFIVLCLAVTVIGFGAGRWRRAKLDHLDEWGLGGRKFGSVITWFLLGGDIYTAYTFIAVPAAVFATGAAGLFAIPYTIIVFPIVFVVMPKLWQVSRNRGYVTVSDYVRERFDSRLLALAVALTGIVATMPYIALQIFGIQVVIAQMGVNVDLALVIAFVVLALFTYVSGLRAPALIAIVKDALIGITVLVLVIYIPSKLGGYGAIFDKVAQVQAHQKVKPPAAPVNYLSIGRAQYAAYASLAFGSALALFLYPHAITGTLAARGQRVIRRNAAYLIPYSLMLGLIALLGYMAIAAGTKPLKASGNNGIVPALLDNMLPGWFAGFAFAAIAIGALVPASVMSIAAANLFSRNVYKEFIAQRDPRPAGDRVQGDVPAGQVRRPGLHPLGRQAERHQLPARRRGADHPDPARGDPRPLRAGAQPLGGAPRLGRGHHHRGVLAGGGEVQGDDPRLPDRRADQQAVHRPGVVRGQPRGGGGGLAARLRPRGAAAARHADRGRLPAGGGGLFRRGSSASPRSATRT